MILKELMGFAAAYVVVATLLFTAWVFLKLFKE